MANEGLARWLYEHINGVEWWLFGVLDEWGVDGLMRVLRETAGREIEDADIEWAHIDMRVETARQRSSVERSVKVSVVAVRRVHLPAERLKGTLAALGLAAPSLSLDGEHNGVFVITAKSNAGISGPILATLSELAKQGAPQPVDKAAMFYRPGMQN